MNTSRLLFLPRQALVSLLALCATSTPVFAQTPQPREDRTQKMVAELAKRFASADKNGDGSLSLDEAKAGMPLVTRNFNSIDKAGKGVVSQADIEIWARQQRDSRGGGRHRD